MTTGRHLHILTRTGRDVSNGKSLSGNFGHLTAGDVRATLNGTPYADQVGIAAVLDRGLDVGYAIPPDAGGWVCVLACTGTDQQQCRDVLTRAVIGGDIRLRKAITGLEAEQG
ncbi:hypothetical protein ACWDUL_38380 [Nocardia niigatensis]